jgi:uncharacterized protein
MTRRATITRQSGFRRIGAGTLPIYCSAHEEERVLFYAPGLVCALDKGLSDAVHKEIERLWSQPFPRQDPTDTSLNLARHAAARLVRAAREAMHEIDAASTRAYSFECLTLYVNNQCNLRCRYCYSRPDGKIGGALSEQGVRDAAGIVAGMCAERNNPFTLAFHGGGEPTLGAQQIDRLLGIVREEAGRFGLHPRTYIATNGAVSEKTAFWLASRFDLVGISCDGPPEIQDRNRPNRNRQPSSGDVERTMATLKRYGRPFHVRVTITRDQVDRQAEIVAYLADRFSPAEVRIEPVYINPAGDAPMALSQVAAFVNAFLAAQKTGRERGIPVTTSITRPGDIYGPHCNGLRRVLNLVPGDVATGCFLYSRPEDIALRGLQTGSFDAIGGTFRLDGARIRSLIARCSKRPAGCDDCFCSSQCTYGCPDRCALEASGASSPTEDGRGAFRCRVNRRLMASMIREAADGAWTHALTREEGNGGLRKDKFSMLNTAVYRNGRKHEVGL